MEAKIAGFILEARTDDPPFVFTETEDLVVAWAELHKLYGVRLSEEEIEVFESLDMRAKLEELNLWPAPEETKDANNKENSLSIWLDYCAPMESRVEESI